MKWFNNLIATLSASTGASNIGISSGGNLQEWLNRFSFVDKSNGDNLVINNDYNKIASDISSAIVAGGGNANSPNLIGYIDYYSNIPGSPPQDTFVSTFDITDTNNVGVFLIRADKVRVQVEQFCDITIVGGKANVVYPTAGNNTNNGPGGSQGSDPYVLSTESVVIIYREATENTGSGSDYSSILGAYDQIIQEGIAQQLIAAPHGRIVGGDHNGIFSGSYHRIENGSYGIITGGTGNVYSASGSGGGFFAAVNCLASGTGPAWGIGANHALSAAYTLAIGFNNAVSGNGSSAIGRENTVSSRDTHASGYNLNLSGGYSAGVGLDNTSTGFYTFVACRSNTVNGSYSAAFGRANIQPGDWSLVTGYNAYAPHDFSHAIGGEAFSSNGDCQHTKLVARRQTTNATPQQMRLGAAEQSITLRDNSALTFTGEIIAKQTNGTDLAGYTFKGVISRGVGAASTTLHASNVVTEYESDASWNVSLNADTSNGSLSVVVTGALTKDINWVATIRFTETRN